jgi:hypothetical protein
MHKPPVNWLGKGWRDPRSMRSLVLVLSRELAAGRFRVDAGAIHAAPGCG